MSNGPGSDDEVKTKDASDWYTWTDNPDEWRRCFLIEYMAYSYEGDADSLIAAMEKVLRWMKSGEEPKVPRDNIRKIK